jgi:hypothetical protein
LSADSIPLEHDSFTDSSELDASSVPPVHKQFTEVHDKTMTLAAEFMRWSESGPFNTAADMFRIDWTGDSLDYTVGRGTKSDDDKVSYQWIFRVAGGISTENDAW